MVFFGGKEGRLSVYAGFLLIVCVVVFLGGMRRLGGRENGVSTENKWEETEQGKYI